MKWISSHVPLLISMFFLVGGVFMVVASALGLLGEYSKVAIIFLSLSVVLSSIEDLIPDENTSISKYFGIASRIMLLCFIITGFIG